MGVVRKKWTDDEVQMLKDLYLTTSREELAATFGVGELNLSQKLGRLGLLKRTKSHETFEEEIKILAPSLVLLDKYNGCKQHLKVKSTECGHEWEIIPRQILDKGTGIRCPSCLSGRAKTQEAFLLEVARKNPSLILLDKYTGATQYIRVQDTKCGHEWEIHPDNFLSKGTKNTCPTCNPRNTTAKLHEHFAQEVRLINTNLEVVGEYTTAKIFVCIRDNSCGHEWGVQPDNFLRQGCGVTCPICTPKGTSKAEIDLGGFLAKYTEVIHSDRKLLDGKEIDIYLPEHNLGIEYNGVYWHNENHKHKDYHLEKTELAASKGITLIQVFEHEDIAIVKSRLLSLIGKTYTLGARKTEVKVIDFPKDFLSENHIQGAGSPSKVNLGLFIKEELVATMTFSKPRFNANYEWELIRYCSLLDVTVVGGASKLLKYFIKSYCPKNILSYSDKRWSTGKLYNSLGFEHLQTSAPGYFYQKSQAVISRHKAQKHKLKELVPEFYDETLTEKEIMNNAGWFRVYDCGQDVWVLTL